MTNALYPKWKQALIQGSPGSALNGSGATGVYAALVDTATYTYGVGHEFYPSISGAIVGTPVEVGAPKSYADGVFDGADLTFAAVSGPTCEAIVLYVQNAGANTTWRLVAYLDTGITNLPVTPNGADITLTFNASGIFGL